MCSCVCANTVDICTCICKQMMCQNTSHSDARQKKKRFQEFLFVIQRFCVHFILSQHRCTHQFRWGLCNQTQRNKERLFFHNISDWGLRSLQLITTCFHLCHGSVVLGKIIVILIIYSLRKSGNKQLPAHAWWNAKNQNIFNCWHLNEWWQVINVWTWRGSAYFNLTVRGDCLAKFKVESVTGNFTSTIISLLTSCTYSLSPMTLSSFS